LVDIVGVDRKGVEEERGYLKEKGRKEE